MILSFFLFLCYYIDINGDDMMKSSKLIDIFKQGNMVIPLYFLQHYKEFKLELGEFIFLMYLYNLGDKFLFDPEKFGNDLNIELMDVMNYVGILTDKHFIRVEVLKNEKGLMEEVVILDDFFSKLSMITIDEVNNTSNSENTNIFEIIEKEFGRTLSPIEYEIIKAWLDSGFSEVLIKEAIKEATMNNVSNLRYIDKILFEWNKSGIKTADDVEKNRKKRNAAREKQDENIDMDIIDYNWFDDDE
jgi:DNA replication protein